MSVLRACAGSTGSTALCATSASAVSRPSWLSRRTRTAAMRTAAAPIRATSISRTTCCGEPELPFQTPEATVAANAATAKTAVRTVGRVAQAISGASANNGDRAIDRSVNAASRTTRPSSVSAASPAPAVLAPTLTGDCLPPASRRTRSHGPLTG